MIQEELDFSSLKPAVSDVDLARVLAALSGRKWTTSKILNEMTGFDERKLRAIAEAANGKILSGPGCPGYRLFDGSATLDDADRAASRLESQARRMLHRAASIRRLYHHYSRHYSRR